LEMKKQEICRKPCDYNIFWPMHLLLEFPVENCCDVSWMCGYALQLLAWGTLIIQSIRRMNDTNDTSTIHTSNLNSFQHWTEAGLQEYITYCNSYKNQSPGLRPIGTRTINVYSLFLKLSFPSGDPELPYEFPHWHPFPPWVSLSELVRDVKRSPEGGAPPLGYVRS
jgi:hypothetical protein